MLSYLQAFLLSRSSDPLLSYLIPTTLLTKPLALFNNSNRTDHPSFDLITRTFYSPLQHSEATVLMRLSTGQERVLTQYKFI